MNCYLNYILVYNKNKLKFWIKSRIFFFVANKQKNQIKYKYIIIICSMALAIKKYILIGSLLLTIKYRFGSYSTGDVYYMRP